MTSSNILSAITFVYAFAAVLYIVSWIFRKPVVGKAAPMVFAAGAVGNGAGIILRWVESYHAGMGHAPFSNLYESLIFFCLTITILSLVIEKRYNNPVIGVFSGTMVFLSMAYASLSPGISDHIEPLIPALKSNWLIAHVMTCFLGYSGFAVAFVVSIMYLLKLSVTNDKGLLSYIPGKDVLDELTHQLVVFGFFFLSIGIITGSVWANTAWGRYWGWDPKETWSLITWFVYATLLHARFMRGWRGKKIAVLSIVGFSAVIFTYFGVNYLPGLHSYGSYGG